MRKIQVIKEVTDDCRKCEFSHRWVDGQADIVYAITCDIFKEDIKYNKPCQQCLDATVKEENSK